VTALRPLRGWVALAVVVALVVALVSFLRGDEGPMRTVTARFAGTPGLYEGNQVQVLGMPVGRVLSIEPDPQGVEVRFEVPEDLALPEQVQAMILAPNLISDRSLALHPAYTGGARLADGAVIPRERTAVPLSADQVIESVDKLALALGPDGANREGDLNNLLGSLATSFGPDGTPLNDTITGFGQALGALGAQEGDLTVLFNSLGQLTTEAARNQESYRSFSTNLASVSAILAAEKSDIATALSTLQRALADLTTFVTDNAATLGSSVESLSTFTAALQRQQASLGESLRTGGVALENLQAAVDPDAPGGPALKVRFDPSATSEALGTQVCGNAVLRLLTVALKDRDGGSYDGKEGQDFACGVNGLVAQLPVPPGAPAPDLTLERLGATP
jgi:virulence factor Mce-like protein